jgi:hypothetical protein
MPSRAPSTALTLSAPLPEHLVTLPLQAQFGVCCGCSQKRKAHCQSPCQPAVCEEVQTGNVSRWFFGVSTGHAASTTFSAASCFSDNGQRGNISWQFEAGHNYGDSRKANTRYGLKAWYQGLEADGGDASGQERVAATVARTVLIPDMIMKAKGRDTVVDLGHHINLGLLGPLQTQLAPNVHFIRIIRSRFDTAQQLAVAWRGRSGVGLHGLEAAPDRPG